ncbi:RloB domain-containing protein [Streptomyces roseoverticillatus]|uniref:RloB family protein n=1 Tax=Streptomyces roseoverticillatus TaxID=66429 RepID=UPI001F1F18F7|nr:RloB family protein [Streptomyces roseoverticillatus]MCF3106353.1 RloB domain-containing protein [Streptomyces roseoverticillatus]
MAKTRGKSDWAAAKKAGSERRRVVHVYTEGKVTEPGFIRIITKQGTSADPTLKVDVRIANANDDGSRRMPIDLVERAVALQQRIQREEKKAKVPSKLRTQVWCLFDHDNHPDVEAALSLADKHKLPVAFSHPCFEVWRVLHLKPATGSFGGVCGIATQRLPNDWHKVPGGIKAVLPEQIKGGYGEAKDRALRMNAQHPEHLPLHKRDPYTDVYEFVEKGLGITAY